jgi:hypothetical protein
MWGRPGLSSRAVGLLLFALVFAWLVAGMAEVLHHEHSPAGAGHSVAAIEALPVPLSAEETPLVAAPFFSPRCDTRSSAPLRGPPVSA